MSSRPKVSIGVPSYNHARFLPAALDSALAQTFRDFEIVIVDDGSSDGSLEIANSYAAKHPSLIRVLTHPGHRNLGISATADLGTRESRGEFRAALPSDDVWHPQMLELEVAFLEEHPHVGFVYGCAQMIDENGQELPGLLGSDVTDEPLYTLLHRNPITAPTVLCRKKCYEEAGEHDSTVAWQDWEMWVRILAHHEAGFINRPLMSFRVHSYNASVGISERLMLERARAVLESVQRKALAVGGRLGETRIRGLIELQLSYFSFCLGEPERADSSLQSAFSVDPSLRSDGDYLTRWLEQRYDYDYQPLAESAAQGDFVEWALPRIAEVMESNAFFRLKRRVTGHQYARSALEHRQINPREAGRMAMESLKADPARLRDRALMGVLAESLVGSDVMSQLRRVKKQLSSGHRGTS